MKPLLASIGIVIALLVAPRLFAGPEPLPTESKESKAVIQAPAPECTWTGFYIGGHGGYGWGGDTSFKEEDEFDPAFRFEREGFLGGGQVGYNLQLGRWFVIGIEGTFSAGDLDDNTTLDAEEEDEKRGHLDTDWIATLGGRVGISFWNSHLLAYAKSGVAFTDYDFHTREVNDDETFHADGDETMPLVGFGLEYSFNCHWSVRAEYNHLFADDDDHITGRERDDQEVESRTFHRDQGDWDLITVGINYRF